MNGQNKKEGLKKWRVDGKWEDWEGKADEGRRWMGSGKRKGG